MKIKRMSGKQYLLHGVFLVAVCIILLFLNDIIAFSYNRTFAPHKGAELKDSTSDVVIGRDRIIAENNLSESLFIKGWALCTTEKDNADKYIQIVLKGNDGFYYYDPIKPSERSDLHIKGARGYNHGFNFYASTLNVPAGVYELFIYCHENDTNYGMRSFNYMLVKDSNGVLVKDWCSQDVKLGTAEDQKFYIALDDVSLTEEKAVSLYGWAYLPGVDSANQKLYLEITDKDGVTRVFDTHQTRRSDLGKISEEAVYAGFNALLEPNSILLGDATIRIILESGNHYFRSAKSIKTVIGEQR